MANVKKADVKKVQVKSGATLSYVDSGQGLPVILIHGLFFNHTVFEHQIKTFAGRVRVVAIDIHGHGESSPLNQPMSLDEMAEDYFDLVQTIGIRQAIWGGVSLGGMTSLHIAIKHPTSVLGLLLLNTSAASGMGKKIPSFKGLNAPLTLRFLWKTPFLKKQVINAGLFGKTTLATKPNLQQVWMNKMKPISNLSMKYAIEAVLGARSLLEELALIHVPTIIAGGCEDTLLPLSASYEIQQRIHHSTLLEIEACGHSSPIEQPQQVNQLLETLLLKVTKSSQKGTDAGR